jgi:hypothetical protein
VTCAHGSRASSVARPGRDDGWRRQDSAIGNPFAIFFPQQLRFAITASPDFGFNSLERCSGTILMNNS